jgi:predicted glycoside hydrolase/deacetylase ChbG (UPF0249 family)
VLNQFATAPSIAKGARKMEQKLIIGAALALTLGGCVSSSKALRNTNGEIITCKVSGYDWHVLACCINFFAANLNELLR